MDHRPHERTRQGSDGLVSPSLLRLLFLLPVATALVSGIVGGLLRAGVSIGPVAADGWVPRAVLAHGFLMASAFLGTVIGLERAVALKKAAAFLAPAASALSGLLVLGGQTAAGAWLALLAAAAFVAVNLVVVRRQSAPHTWLLLVAAAAWLAGALLHAVGGRPEAVIAWWFAFLVLTIAAERLEMTRLMRRRRGSAPLLYAASLALPVGCALSSGGIAWGGLLYGAALLALAAWLLGFDIARRTIATHGLSRYMACCLLPGYGWLAVAGIAWVASTLGLPWRDAALHALALGFVFSMIFGHAPVILPALARIKLAWTPAFYLPLVLLHLSLAARLLLAPFDPAWLRLGALGNVAAIVLFVATVVAAALAWAGASRPAPSRM